MNRAALQTFRQHGHREREGLRGQSIVITMGESVSPPIMAASITTGSGWQVDDNGRRERVQRCTFTVRKDLLPTWATADSLPTEAKVTIDGVTFKIMNAHDHEVTLYITAIRWPDDPV